MPTAQLQPVHCKLLNTWTLLATGAAGSSHTGDLLEFTHATVVLPAAMMGPNGILRIWTIWSYTNSANNKTLKVKLGATAYLNIVRTTSACEQDVVFIRNRNAQNSQISQPANYSGLGAGSGPFITGAIDTSASQNITFTGQLALGTETVTLEAWSVEVYYGA